MLLTILVTSHCIYVLMECSDSSQYKWWRRMGYQTEYVAQKCKIPLIALPSNNKNKPTLSLTHTVSLMTIPASLPGV